MNTTYEEYASNTKKQELNEMMGKHVLELSVGERGMKYRISKKNKDFIVEINLISELGYSYLIKDKVMRWYDEAVQYNKENLYISTLESRYNTIMSKMQSFQEEILVKEIQEVKKLITHPKIKKNIG
jgi:hypothetical protein